MGGSIRLSGKRHASRTMRNQAKRVNKKTTHDAIVQTELLLWGMAFMAFFLNDGAFLQLALCLLFVQGTHKIKSNGTVLSLQKVHKP